MFDLLIFAAFVAGIFVSNLLIGRGFLTGRPTWIRVVGSGAVGLAVIIALQAGVYAAFGFPDR